MARRVRGAHVSTRHAALLLATLHPADQRWLLGRLPRATRSTLAPLLREAERHGLALDHASVEEGLAEADGRAALATTLDLPVAARAEALRGWPSAWAAAMLAACPTEDRDALLARLPPADAGLLAAMVEGPDGQLPVALAQALVAEWRRVAGEQETAA